MTESTLKPLVGVISDVKLIEPHPYHIAGDKYLRALTQAADVVPVIIPTLNDEMSIEHWMAHLDGVFLTGAYSMVNPGLYGEGKIDEAYEYDNKRDELSRALISLLIDQDKPLFAACRGLQDINVALGGSLHQSVHEVEGLEDHREDKGTTLDLQYADIHPVNIVDNGLMREITGKARIMVNSLHSQGIKQLANGLFIEATAEDGLIEAFSIEVMSFGLAVQWHPEWLIKQNPIQQTLYKAFGKACRQRKQN